MVRRGRHAADDGSLPRSVGAAALRGVVLLAVAVVLGIVLLNAADSGSPFDQPVTAGASRTTTTVKRGATPAATTTVATTAPLKAAAQTKVLVANGTTTKGLAGQYKDRVRAAGYNTLAATDVLDSKKPVAATTVFFRQGFENEAKALAEKLTIPAANVKPLPAQSLVASLQAADILVVIGADKAPATTTTSTKAKSSPASSTTTTAASRATTTTR